MTHEHGTDIPNIPPSTAAYEVFRDSMGKYFAKGSDTRKLQPCETCGKKTMMGDTENIPATSICILRHDNKYHRFCSEGCNK